MAIRVGAALGVMVDIWADPNALTIAAVVAVRPRLGGWRRLGVMGGLVPVAGLFVLILGDADPGGYVLAYGGLTAVGAVIGKGVNLAFPSLPMDSAAASLAQLRDTLAGQFDELAEALLSERPVPDSEWQERAELVESVSDRVRATVLRAMEARRGNWRARRWRVESQRQYQTAIILIQLPFIVEDLTAILVQASKSDEAPSPGRASAAESRSLGRAPRSCRSGEVEGDDVALTVDAESDQHGSVAVAHRGRRACRPR